MMVLRISAAAGALLLWASGLAQAVAPIEMCRAERAVYTLKSDPAFTAGFIPAQHFASMASNLYFWVRSPQRTYYFTFMTGNGYTGITLGPVGSPYVAADGDPNNGPVDLKVEDGFSWSMRIYPMRLDMTVEPNPPNSGDPAPAALFAPELGTVLWYTPRSISGDPLADRDPMVRGVFLRTGCLDETPKAGYP